MESIFTSRVEGRGYHVEGNNFFFIFFLKMENKWKTNKKNLKKGAWTSPSILVLPVGWEGGGQNMLLDNRLLNISDYLRTSSALLTNHHILKNEVKQV